MIYQAARASQEECLRRLVRFLALDGFDMAYPKVTQLARSVTVRALADAFGEDAVTIAWRVRRTREALNRSKLNDSPHPGNDQADGTADAPPPVRSWESSTVSGATTVRLYLESLGLVVIWPERGA